MTFVPEVDGVARDYPSPWDLPYDFRASDPTRYRDVLEDVSRRLLEWGLACVTCRRGDFTPTRADRRMHGNLPQLPSESVRPGGSARRLHNARWCTPAYLDAWERGDLGSTHELSVVGEHPHSKRVTIDLMRSAAVDFARQAEGMTRDDVHDLMALETEAMIKLLDSRSSTVLVLRSDELVNVEGSWIIPSASEDGWARYANCPDNGLWDRLKGEWVKPWEEEE